MKNASANPILEIKTTDHVKVKEKLGKVDVVVQEYMDNLLGDLFPELEAPTAEPPVDNSVRAIPESKEVSKEVSKEERELVTTFKAQPEHEIETPPERVIPPPVTILKPDVIPDETAPQVTEIVVDVNVTPPDLKLTSDLLNKEPNEPEIRTYAKVIPHVSLPDDINPPPVEEVAAIKNTKPVKPSTVYEAPVTTAVHVKTDPLKSDVTLPNVDIPIPKEIIEDIVAPRVNTAPLKEIEKRFPKAPDWAQESFDVLLFDVCGLKLAVPMESLGRIIKVEHETNQLIGRPSWFMGAYNEADEHLYVVDTAKYMMPEKGYDLERDGFEYLIQLQKSKWTLACKNVHTTVRLEPDQVKWRSSQGKRQWLSGTVIEHMCALIHVDNLVELLEINS